MPVLKDNALIFPLRPLGLKEETETMKICKGWVSWQSFPSLIWPSSQPCPKLNRSEYTMGASPSHHNQWTNPIALIREMVSRAQSFYLSKTLRSQFRLMSTHRGTLTRMPLSSSSRSYKAVRQWMTSTTSITCSLACRSCSLKISRAVVKVTRSTGKEGRDGKYSPKKKQRTAEARPWYHRIWYQLQTNHSQICHKLILCHDSPIPWKNKATRGHPKCSTSLCTSVLWHQFWENGEIWMSAPPMLY